MHSNDCSGIDLERGTDTLYDYLRIFILFIIHAKSHAREEKPHVILTYLTWSRREG